MTQTTEPTLSDIVNRLDRLDTSIDKLSNHVEKFNDRFTNYQQATQ